MVSDSDLVTRLREILRDSDLETATPASVRRQLEAYFSVDLTDKKVFVREQIDAFLESDGMVESKQKDEENCNGVEDEEEGSESDEEKIDKPVKAKKRRGGFNKVCQLSPTLEKFIGTSQLARTEVVKKMWAYIREHDLQDPKNRRNIICDESLHSLFRVKTINMFQMNKALAKHIWPLSDGDGCVNNVKEEEDNETSGERDEKEEQSKDGGENNEEEIEEEVDRSVRKCKKRKSAKSGEKTKKTGGGFTKVCSLSPELQAFTGTPQLARTEVVKMLWSYIKEKNLQDPSDKRTIICDESLRTLFPMDSINMFQMNKHLTKHIWPLVEDEEGTAESPKKGKQKVEIKEDSDEPDEIQPKKEESDEPDKKRPKKEESADLPAPSLPLSDALVKFLGPGETPISKDDVFKRIWEYINQNDLQDPSDESRILCDEKLKELFEVDSFQGNSVSELLTNHFIKTEQ